MNATIVRRWLALAVAAVRALVATVAPPVREARAEVQPDGSIYSTSVTGWLTPIDGPYVPELLANATYSPAGYAPGDVVTVNLTVLHGLTECDGITPGPDPQPFHRTAGTLSVTMSWTGASRVSSSPGADDNLHVDAFGSSVGWQALIRTNDDYIGPGASFSAQFVAPDSTQLPFVGITTQRLRNETCTSIVDHGRILLQGGGTPVAGGNEPFAAFQAQPSGANPFEVAFTNRSTDPEDSIDDLTFAWDFGDETSSTERDPVHVYDDRGDYTVVLTATDTGGASDTETQVIEVGGPALEGAIFPFPDGDSIVKEGEAVDIRLRVENDGDEPLTDVAITSIAVLATDPDANGLAVVTAKPGGESLSGTLGVAADGTNLDFADFSVDPQRAGTVRVAMTVVAKKPDGTAIEAVIDWDLEIDPAPLLVQLSARVPGDPTPPGPGEPFEFLLNENDHDNTFEVVVKVTNQGDETVDNVAFLEPSAPIDFDSLRVDENGVPIPGVAVEPLDDPAPGLPMDELDPGESVSQVYSFEGIDAAHAKLSAIVLGRMGDEAVSGRGSVTVKVLSDVLVEFGLKDPRAGDYEGGQVIRMNGVLRNVTEDTTVGVVVYPTTDGNAGNGIVFPSNLAGSKTPTAPYGFVLVPGQEIDVSALVITEDLVVSSDAIVDWEVHVWKHEVDEATGEIVKTKAAATQTKILDADDGWVDSIQVRLPPAEVLPDVVGECQWAYFGCGVLVGLDRLAKSGFAFAKFAGNTLVDFGNQELRLLAWSGEMLGQIGHMFTGDPQAAQRLIDEMVLDFQSLVGAGAITLGQGQSLAAAVGSAFADFVETWDRMYRTGDLEQIQFELGRIAGENPDMAFGVLVATNSARKSLMNMILPDSYVRHGLERAVAERTESFGTRLAAAETEAAAGGTPVTQSGVFDAGDELSKQVIGDYWGGDPRDVDTLMAVAQAEQVNITFGSKVAEVLAKVKAGLAWPAPRELMMKPISEIDIQFLGYRPGTVGRYELVTPPKDLDLVLVNNLGDCCVHPDDIYVKLAARDWVLTHHPGLDPALTQRVASQLQTRIEEFIVYYEKYIDRFPVTQADGSRISPVGFEYNFGPGTGPKTFRTVWDERGLKLAPVESAATPDPERIYYQMTLDGAGTGDFRPIVGGIEILSITELDGTIISDVLKRERIYDDLQKAIGMSNGELGDFVGTGTATPLRAYAEGTEAAVTIGPGNEARASYFREARSIVEGSPNAGKRLDNALGDFVLMVGPTSQWKARSVVGSLINRLGLYDALSSWYKLPVFFLPNVMYRFVTGMNEPQAPDEFDRDDGANVRADGDGGLEQFGPDGGDQAQRLTEAVSEGWHPISLAEALKLGSDPGVLEISPMTTLTTSVLPGDAKLDIADPESLAMPADTPWFKPGDKVIINPGGDNEEHVTVTALGSLVLSAPVVFEHLPGEMVIRELGPSVIVSPPPPPVPAPGVTTTTVVRGRGSLPATGGAELTGMVWALLMLAGGLALISLARSRDRRERVHHGNDPGDLMPLGSDTESAEVRL
jgi:PKD repeat protein